jgi:hypothetical protein
MAEAANHPTASGQAGLVTIAAFAPIGSSGIVQEGCSEVDESAVTGAVLPVLKKAGDHLLAGSRNGAGRLAVLPDPISDSVAPVPATPGTPVISRQAISGDSLVGPFLHALFRRLVLIDLAILAAAIVWLIRRDQPLTVAGVALIVIGLLSPGMFLVWPLQRLALRGWLKLHRLYCPDLARLHDLLGIRRLLFGRHGTLSQGHLRIVSLQAAPAATPAELVVLAASAHQDIEDVWGKAFLAFGISHRVHLRPAEKVTVQPGLGLSALVYDKTVLVGHAAWLEQQGIVIVGLDEPVQEHLRLGRHILFVGIAAPEPRCLGVIAFADPPRAGASLLIRTCKQSGMDTVLIGDLGDPATATLAGLTGASQIVPMQDGNKFDADTTLAVARTSDRDLLAHYDQAVALGETTVREVPGVPFGILRNDIRHALDFVVLAQLLARRLPLTLLLVWVTGWPLVVDGLGLLAIPSFLRIGCLAIGILVALFQSQLLRLVDSIANDEPED